MVNNVALLLFSSSTSYHIVNNACGEKDADGEL